MNGIGDPQRARVSLVKQVGPLRRWQVLTPLQPNALEVFLLALCAWSGFFGLVALVNGEAPIVQNIPTPIRAGWFVLLLLGGTAGVVGCYLPDPIMGMVVLRTALMPVAAGAGMYAVAELGYNGRLAPAFVVGALAVAAARRIHQLIRTPLRILGKRER